MGMTAKEFLESRVYITQDGVEDVHDSVSNVEDVMIAFATMHVEAALQAAASNVHAELEPMNWLAEQHMSMPLILGEDYEIGISRQSILSSYPLNLIK